MTMLIRMMESRIMMWLCGMCGDSLCMAGIIMALLDRKVAGFKPSTWILPAMVFYMYFIISMLARILATIAGQQEGAA